MALIKVNKSKDNPVALPCPFCGKIEDIYFESYEHQAGERYRIVCLNCMASIDRGYDQQTDALLDAWNNRAA